MSKSKYIVLITVAIILILVVSSVSFITLNKNSVTDDNYKKIIADARDAIWLDINSGKASSGTIAVMDGGQIVYSEGFAMADRENSTQVDPQTVFNIGSISKTFCTAAIMKLVDDGLVKLDDNVTEYLPDFTMADPHYPDITVRMLLDHSCGLPGTVSANDVGYVYNPDFYKDTLKVLSQAHLRSVPGEIAPYTNDGFTVAEMIVARVSGMNYSEYLSQKMTRTTQYGSYRRNGPTSR